MGKIQQLSPHVADLIAAGEVVERPASAAKELVENAIDAGANNITVEIHGGGMTFLRVTDDGCGMSREDARTAFLRHATSKLRQASDLEAISTLGFRGEDLAAISAVSRIDLLTKTADEDFGTSLHLEAGVITEESEAGCPQGTTIIVRDLFYNTPARMKFMKRDPVEAAALLSTVQRLALAHPEVSIRVLRDGEEQLRTVGDGVLRSAIHGVMGRVTAKEMIPVESAWDKYRLSGFVSKPTASRGKRSNELFFVNGRNVRSQTMTVALEEAYRNRMMTGRFPSCVLHLTLPEHLVDVNVHPAKVEVKFLNEKDVFDCVLYGVKGALDRGDSPTEMKLPQRSTLPPEAPQPERGSADAAPTLHTARSRPREDFYQHMSARDFREFAETVKTAPRSDTPRGQQSAERFFRELEAQAEKKERPDPAAVPTQEEKKHSPSAPKQEERAAPRPASEGEASFQRELPLPKQEDLPPLSPQAAEEAVAVEAAQEFSLIPEEKTYRFLGEALDTYLIIQEGEELLFIDKHAAHERILFERLRAHQEPILSQLLLQPLLCRLEREEMAILLENDSFMSEFGFSLSDFGSGVLSVSQIPADLSPEEVESTLSSFASDLRKGKQTDKESVRDELLHSLACKAAIKGGRPSDPRELEALAVQVMEDESLRYCPHGRPICIRLTRSQLERQFKRS